MGSLCSKCFKHSPPQTKPPDKTVQTVIPDSNKNQLNITNSQVHPQVNPNPVSPISVKKIEEEPKVVELKVKVEESKDQNYQLEKKDEEVKETKVEESHSKKNSIKHSYDEYFDEKELSYYKKLYDTEEFDNFDLKKIIRFQKGELIGEGSFGRVYRGFDGDGGQIIAIKEIDLSRINSKNLDRIKSFEQEIDILSKLNNKNIIKYYGTHRTDKQLNIFLEYCIGGSIAKMLEIYGKFKENLIRKYTKQILEGLEYLHAHNVIHRDIKGANILVDKDGVCKLSDFGGAKKIAEEIEVNKQNSFKGTPHWMAPETIKLLETSRYSDIWSLGCTIIEMATGEPPWSEFRSPISALYNILNADKPPQLPNFLSNDLLNFLGHCMKMNPRERLNVHKLLRHPFITGDSVFVYEGKRLSVGSKNFKSENYQKALIEKKMKGMNSHNIRDRKSTDDIRNEELHFSQINPVVQSLDNNKLLPLRFESNNLKKEAEKKVLSENKSEMTMSKSAASKRATVKSVEES